MALGRKTGGGSRKGIPNRATADVREAISLLAERNIAKLEGWIEEVAESDPAKAADLLLRTLEYHVPKMSRVEATVGHAMSYDQAVQVLLSNPDSKPLAEMSDDELMARIVAMEAAASPLLGAKDG